MQLTLQSSKSAQTFDLAGPGGSLCFASRDQVGNRSSVWMVKAHTDKSDVYVGNHGLADFVKFSLHRDGRWHYAWTQEQAPIVFPDKKPDSRWIDRWQRPPELGSGWTLALRIWILPEDLNAAGPPLPPRGLFRDACPSEDDVFWAPEPEFDTCWGFHVWLGRPDQGVLEIRNAIPVGGFTLGDDRDGSQACLVMLGRKQLRPEDLDWVDAERKQLVANALAAGIDPRVPTRRAVLYVQGNDEVREVFDLALSVAVQR